MLLAGEGGLACMARSLSVDLRRRVVDQILAMLSEASIGYVSDRETDDSSGLYDAVLDCKEGGAWTWTTAGSTSA